MHFFLVMVYFVSLAVFFQEDEKEFYGKGNILYSKKNP